VGRILRVCVAVLLVGGTAACHVPGDTATDSTGTTTTEATDLTDGTAGTTPSGTVSPSGSGTVSPSPSSPPVPVPVAGYAYGAPPTQFNKQLSALSGSYQGVFTGVTARSITKGGKDVAAIVIYRIEASVIGSKGFEDQLLNSLLTGLSGKGAAVRRSTVGDQPVATGTSKGGGGITAWYRDGEVVVVMGANQDETHRFVQGYLGVK